MIARERALCLAWMVGLITCSVAHPQPTAAQKSPPTANAGLSQSDAAVQFDAGVAAYKAKDYARAAELFLVADGLAPSVTALSNALAAARRTQDPLLMARAGQRGLTRSGLSEADKRSARSMLAQAEPKLARLDLRCERTDCAPSLDGAPVAVGINYAEPGAHRARDAAGSEQEATCGAGQLCALTLAIPKTAPEPPPSVAAPTAAPAPAAVASAAVPAASEPPAPAQPVHDAKPPRWKQRLPLGVLIASGASAVLFGGLSVWQGVAALNKQDSDWDEAHAMARRSDAFMATGIALAGVAAATAIWWVDWDMYSHSQLALLPEGGATLTTRRRF